MIEQNKYVGIRLKNQRAVQTEYTKALLFGRNTLQVLYLEASYRIREQCPVTMTAGIQCTTAEHYPLGYIVSPVEQYT